MFDEAREGLSAFEVFDDLETAVVTINNYQLFSMQEL
jgi:hypothetical protein